MGGKRKSLEKSAESKIDRNYAERHANANAFENRLANSPAGSIDTALGGRGRETYEEFASTGGFSPEDRERFLERSTSAIPGIYGRQEQELERRSAISGGGGPGFTASRARLQRMKSQDVSNAKVDAQGELSSQVRSGRMAGAGGLATTRAQAGQEYLQGEALRLQNKIQTGQLDAADIAALVAMRNDSPGLFDQIMKGIQVGAGAVTGLAGAFGGGK